MLWSRLIRVAHTEVNNIFTMGSGFSLELVNYIKDIGRKALYAREVLKQ